jgi:hypothetical protein
MEAKRASAGGVDLPNGLLLSSGRHYKASPFALVLGAGYLLDRKALLRHDKTPFF